MASTLQQSGSSILRRARRHPGLLLVVLVCVVYLPVLRNHYIWDDDDYVLENELLHDVEGLRDIWLKPRATPQYYPLVHTSFWIEYQLWGLHPLGYHAVNVVLHALVTLLVWLVLRRLRVPYAWLAALLFGLHPVHVESVAWITERKNVLSGVFYLAAFRLLLETFRHAPEAEPSTADRYTWQWRPYLLGTLCFVAALLSKSVTATLPAALILMLWWRQRPVLTRWRCWLALVPLFAIGIGTGLHTAHLEQIHVGAAGEAWSHSFIERAMIAGRALWFYLGKMLWPHPLAFFYEHWHIDGSHWWQLGWGVSYVGVLAALWHWRRRIGEGWVLGLCFFAGSLFPALGFLNVFPHIYSFVADHFNYLASIGPLAMLAALIGWTARQRTNQRQRYWLHAGATLICLAFAALTIARLPVFYDQVTLWRDTIAKTPTSDAAHHNLAKRLEERGQPDEALHHYYQAVRHHPQHAFAHARIANLLQQSGDMATAETHLQLALAYAPDHWSVRTLAGNIYAREQQFQLAIDQFRQALELHPRFLPAFIGAAQVLMQSGHPERAIPVLERGLQLQPQNEALKALLEQARQQAVEATPSP